MKFLKFYHLSEPPQQASLRHGGGGCQDGRTARAGGAGHRVSCSTTLPSSLRTLITPSS